MTPISRSFVKGRSYFFWQRRLPISHSFLPATVFELRPFLRFMAASASRIAPDTHQDQAAARPRPAPWRHSRAPEERWYRSRIQKNFTEPWLPACRRQSPNGLRCGRSAVTAAGDGDPASNSVQLVAAPVTVFGSPDRRRPQANSSGKVSILKSNDQPNRSTTSGFAVNASKLSGIWVRRRFVHDTAHLS